MTNSSHARTQLQMRRTLTELPPLQLPPAYTIRSFRSEDIDAWVALLDSNGELGEWSRDRAEPYFATDSRMPLDGSFFILENSVPVSTAQLHLHHADRFGSLPELGWVAVCPSHRGRGLGYYACLAVLRYAQEQGHQDVFLLTDDARLPAIATYLRLGFEPWKDDPTADERWIHVFEHLRQGRSRRHVT